MAVNYLKFFLIFSIICLFFHFIYRLDAIPSANLRQHKLEQQRLKIEQKQKQKREGGKLIQASDLKSASSVKRGARPLSGRRELHGYEGPLQFLHGNNPDEMTTVQVDIQFFSSTIHGFYNNWIGRLFTPFSG